MVAITWPINTAPGKNAQDGAGRLINAFPEMRQNGQGVVYRRAPGAIAFSATYPMVASMTGTITASFVGQGGQGQLSATGTVTPTFVGST